MRLIFLSLTLVSFHHVLICTVTVTASEIHTVCGCRASSTYRYRYRDRCPALKQDRIRHRERIILLP